MAGLGIACDAEQILVVQGAQQAIDLCARLLLDTGDAFAFDDPGYLIARRCFEAAGARCLSMPVDADGLDTASARFTLQSIDTDGRVIYVGTFS